MFPTYVRKPHLAKSETFTIIGFVEVDAMTSSYTMHIFRENGIIATDNNQKLLLMTEKNTVIKTVGIGRKKTYIFAAITVLGNFEVPSLTVKGVPLENIISVSKDTNRNDEVKTTTWTANTGYAFAIESNEIGYFDHLIVLKDSSKK